MSARESTAPRTHEAEQAVLSALLLAPEALPEVATILAPSDFASGRHGRIFDALREVAAKGLGIDPITVSACLEERSQLASVGGKDYLAELLDVVPTPAHVMSHARIVSEHAQRRALAAVFQEGTTRAQEGALPPADIAANTRVALQAFERTQRTGAARFTLYDDRELTDIAPPAWLVDGVLPSNGLALLVGEKGTLKTFAALDIAASVQLGLEWHGHRVRTGAACYVYGEGHTGLAPRVDAWKRHHEAEHLGLLFLPQRVMVNEGAETASLVHALADRLAGQSVALIVLDTLNRHFAGNENSSEDMSAFVRGCDALREATGATVLVVHHKGHGQEDRGRGSSVLDAAADTIIFCSRDADRLTLECRKQKDAGEFPAMAFEAVPAAHSLVLKPSGVTSGDLKGQRLQILRDLHDNSTTGGLTYSAWITISGLKGSSFNKARDWLRTNGLVETVAGKWKTTDTGSSALTAAHSTNSTPLHSTPSGAAPLLHSTLGGSYKDPPSGVEERQAHQQLADLDAAARAREPIERLCALLLEAANGAGMDPVSLTPDDCKRGLALLSHAPVDGPLRSRAFRAMKFPVQRAELRALHAALAP